MMIFCHHIWTQVEVCKKKFFSSIFVTAAWTNPSLWSISAPYLCWPYSVGVRGTVVAVGSLDRSKEELFKSKQKIENIQSLNNVEFSKDGNVLTHRQFRIGSGKVSIMKICCHL